MKMRWRPFWITAALLGSVNLAHFAYFKSLPVYSGSKSAPTEEYRYQPVWMERAAGGLNLPGAILALGPLWAFEQHSSLSPAETQLIAVALMNAFGTLFWAVVAGYVVRPAKGVKPHDAPPARSR